MSLTPSPQLPRCGRCRPRGELNGKFIPAVEISYPFNNSITSLLVKEPLNPVVPSARLSGYALHPQP